MSADAPGAKSLAIVLAGSPHTGERAQQALDIARAALARGHRVGIFATRDGVYATVADNGSCDTSRQLAELTDAGLRLEVCGYCSRRRDVSEQHLCRGASPSGLAGLGALITDADTVLCL